MLNKYLTKAAKIRTIIRLLLKKLFNPNPSEFKLLENLIILHDIRIWCDGRFLSLDNLHIYFPICMFIRPTRIICIYLSHFYVFLCLSTFRYETVHERVLNLILVPCPKLHAYIESNYMEEIVSSHKRGVL